MEAGSLIAMFFFGTLFTLWIIFSVHARERLTSARSLGIRLTAAQDAVMWSLALPSFLVVWAFRAAERLWRVLRYIGITIRSLCKAIIRACARKWYRLCHRRHHPALSAQKNDLEISRVTNRDLYSRPLCSALLQIPAEIREIIIKMSLVHYDLLDCRPTILLRPRKQFRDAMAFIRTCRQIYQEGHPIVFGSTLFHIWTRNPFYRQLKPVVWNEFTMIHLAAQLNSQLTSRIGAAIRDLNYLLGLRDLYISIWDFIDFENNKNAIAGVFGPLRIRLKDLSLVQINIICPRAINPRAEKHLKTLIVAAKGAWPTGREFGILRTLQGSVTRWRAYIKLQDYEAKREVGVDEDLVALPWDGEHV